MNEMSAETVLTTTRTVRKRLDLTRPVDLAVVRECLTIALQAPSASNRQEWQFVVVADAAQRAAIGEVYRKACTAYLESERAAGKLFADDPERSAVQQRVHASITALADTMGQAPVLLIPCVQTGVDLPAGNQAGLWATLLPAVWSFMLAARTRGLGTAWTTLHLGYEAEVAEILGLPAGVHQAALIPVAYYTGDSFKPAPRQPLDDVLHVDRW